MKQFHGQRGKRSSLPLLKVETKLR
uniref:Uncharacterized protein n=1 Tax=Arundo donax TaxID=35708 RepID=A0A0A9BVK4_ARUDO